MKDGALTPREREVLALIAAGRKSREIAVELGITLRTVNTHRTGISKKVGSSSVAVLTRYALANGLVDVQDH